MDTSFSTDGAAAPAHARPLLPVANRPAMLLLAGLLCLAMPTIWSLATTLWGGEEQTHGPVLLCTALWLLWRQRDELAALPSRPAKAAGAMLLVLAAASYVLGRSQAVIQFEVGGVWLALAAVFLLLKGWRALGASWLPFFVMLFLVPLPGVMVQVVTIPLKAGVSVVAEWLLHQFDYPIARSGVILAIGRYQLLVADACAGLTSIFTLEALGLVYVNQRGRKVSAWHRAALALLLLPISFVSNVVRVVILVLVTYHWGDAAGQGFVHGFAGVVLFGVATLLLVATDQLLGRYERRRNRHG